MIEQDAFSFEPLPWETLVASAREHISAAALLTAAEAADGDEFEEALARLRHNRVLPEMDLPQYAAQGEAALRLRFEQSWVGQGMPLEKLEQSDPLRLYLEELSTLRGDIGSLLQPAAAGDAAARRALTDRSLGRVVELAAEYIGHNILLTDLIQEGSLGLWEAVQSYCGGDFPALRDWHIRFFIVCAILRRAREDGVDRKMREALTDFGAVREQLLGELGRYPTLEQIARRMHITADFALAVEKMEADARKLHSVRTPQEPAEEQTEEDQAVEDTAYFRMRARIEELLSTLCAEDARLLSLRFGLESGLPKSVEETGKIMGLTSDEVLQREAAALASLRNDR